MPEFPSGAVTLVFTDIEGSSALWEAHHAAFSPVLEKHNELMRAAVEKFRGCEVKTEGDAFFLAFAEASDAVRFSVAAQIALQQFDWSSLLPGLTDLRVRIGMHTGTPILSSHPDGTADYFGPVVNRAARVGSAGYGGQILVSSATKDLANGAATDFENLGLQRLKGVGEEVIWQVVHPKLPSRFPPLKTMAGAKHNLPAPQTPFIGREEQIAEWSELLLEPSTRLLTLTAFGGQGKTRSALQIAEKVVGEFADGVWWVELEPARQGEAMEARITHELGLHLKPQPSLREQLHDFLKEREVLLLLDNTEQIPDAGQVVSELLAASPKLKCLVTTRLALQIRQEKLVVVPPLPSSDAAKLFAERAANKVADFVLTAENSAAVGELCNALEGVPLAIELAASRLAVLSPSEMLERLDERFRLLQTKAPDLPPRQRALRGAIDWSYELLSDDEKTLLATLSIFEGGFTLAAVEAVSDDFEALDGIAQLQRHSFLRREVHGNQTRFSMSVSVHAYAAEKLGAEPSDSLERHANYYLKFAEKCAGQLRTTAEAAALDNFWPERANLAAALGWYSAQRKNELAGRLAVATHELLYRLGFWAEARSALQKGLTALSASTDHDKLRAVLLLRLASLAYDVGQLDEALEGAQGAWELAKSAGHDNGIVEALNLKGLIALDRGRNEEAERFLHEALAGRASSDEIGRSVTLHNLAMLASRQGDTNRARELYTESLEHCRKAGDTRGEADTLGNLGVMAHLANDLETAGQLYQESLQLRRTLRDQIGLALMLNNLGEIEVTRQHFERAIALFSHSHRIFRELGSSYSEAVQANLRELENLAGDDFSELQIKTAGVPWEELF